jgi:FkbM family methyltransferase
VKTAAGKIEFPRELAERLAGNPIRLVDVGARGGLETPWVTIAPLLEVVGFEPSKEAFERLRPSAPKNVTYLNVALGDRPGKATLYRTRSAGGTSMYRPNASFLDAFEKDEAFEVVSTSVCRVETLDHVLAEAGIDRVDFIKLDTQGGELPILEGAVQTLQQFVFGVEVEVGLNPIYERQPLFGDVDAFLRRHGYELFELKPQWRLRYSGRGLRDGGRGQWVWGDAVYLKRPAAVADRLASINVPARTMEVVKLVSICLLYGIGDYALDVIASAELPEAAARELAETVRRHDELWASRLGIEYTFVLTPELSAQLHKLVRGRGERQRHRPPEWLAVRAVRRWLEEHAPPSRAERLHAQLRRTARTVLSALRRR